ncbi:MAG TPA: hypothetical protein VG942_15370 [Hyphomonadaceae bacterium]|nr:hypothetical protein [Hyphomonadaceae bacterium]
MSFSPWQDYLMAFFAAAFLTNGIPHFVHGVSGKQFPTPFSGGAGTLDSAVRNVFWGAANLAAGGVLLWAIRDALSDWTIIFELGAVATLGGAALGNAFANPRRNRKKPEQG